MTKLPMIRAGLPAKSGKDKTLVPKNFDQAFATLRKASGRPEYRLVPLRCAVHDKPFVVIYRRDDAGASFRIEKISKETPAKAASGGLIGRFLAGERAELAVYDHEDFNSAGRHCPWCNDKGTVVHCGACDQTYCGGTIVTAGDGGQTYKCVARCGSQGRLNEYDKMHGKRGAPQLRKGQMPLPANNKKAALPPPNRLRLPGK